MVKLNKSPRNLELDINAVKTDNSAFYRGKHSKIPRQTANSASQRENQRENRATPRVSVIFCRLECTRSWVRVLLRIFRRYFLPVSSPYVISIVLICCFGLCIQ